jgi:hypothetical protein
VEVLIWEFKEVLRVSPEVGMGELVDGEWWGKDGVRKWGAAVLDLLEADREGSSDEPVPVGPYFKDIDPSTSLLPPQLSKALRLLHDLVAGHYDLVKHHPPILGVTGNRVSMGNGLRGRSLFVHRGAWMELAGSPPCFP